VPEYVVLREFEGKSMAKTRHSDVIWMTDDGRPLCRNPYRMRSV
jgi:hypothetical protein